MQWQLVQETNRKSAKQKSHEKTRTSAKSMSESQKAEEEVSMKAAPDVFYQKSTAVKGGLKLNQNEVDLISSLKERLVGIMNMGPN